MMFAVRSIRARIGVEIMSDTETLLSGGHADEIRALLDQHGVVVFPNINLADEQQLIFAKSLGGVIEQGEKGIYKVSLDPRESSQAEYLRGTFCWHFDGFSEDVPNLASMLSARKLSAVGGQTEFANTYAAYDDLPEKRKGELQGLRVVHTFAGTQLGVFPNPTADQRAVWAQHKDKIHPLIWTHRSGRKSLLIGSSATSIVGMNTDDGRDLLDGLLAWATQPQFVYRHEWGVGDLVIWNNTGSMHRVVPYPADGGRMMHRTTLIGEEAVA
jgi:alpha-ketoglutarate-dependent taurine dioxygenase